MFAKSDSHQVVATLDQGSAHLVVHVESVVLRSARDVVSVRGQTHEVLLVHVAGERPAERSWRGGAV